MNLIDFIKIIRLFKGLRCIKVIYKNHKFGCLIADNNF